MMKYIFRFTAVVLTLCMLISLCGCFGSKNGEPGGAQAPEGEAPASTDKAEINLPYSARDSLNPFKAQTDINRALTPLLYDSLFEVDDSFKAIPLIVSGYVLTDEAIRVSIAPEAVFSDGSAVTAQDVVYSFEQAKKSERYKGTLTCFKEAQAISADTVSFVYSRDAADALNLLTFPVVKNGTNENDAGKEPFDIPAGGGRYALSLDKSGSPYLACYSGRLGGFKPAYSSIGLYSVAENTTAAAAFSLDYISVVQDSFSAGSYSKIIGTSKQVTMPNFVYLVFNKKNDILKQSKLRTAISLAADRQELADFCFISYAEPVVTPFHSEYYKLRDIDTDIACDTAKAAGILDALGYTNINETGKFRYGKNPVEILTFSLAVCQDNEFKLSAAEKIKEQLEKVNIKINIYKYSEEDFFKVVSSGDYDMYIGECRLKNNLDISEFFDASSSVSSGIDTYCESAKAWDSYKKAGTDIGDFIKVFSEEMPFLPLLYRNGRITSNTAMSPACESIVTDYYFNADKWMIQSNDQ